MSCPFLNKFLLGLSQATLNQIIVIVLSVYTPCFLFTEMGIEVNDILLATCIPASISSFEFVSGRRVYAGRIDLGVITKD